MSRQLTLRRDVTAPHIKPVGQRKLRSDGRLHAPRRTKNKVETKPDHFVLANTPYLIVNVAGGSIRELYCERGCFRIVKFTLDDSNETKCPNCKKIYIVFRADL